MGLFTLLVENSQCARDVVDTVALPAGDSPLCTGLLLTGPLLPGEAAGAGPPLQTPLLWKETHTALRQCLRLSLLLRQCSIYFRVILFVSDPTLALAAQTDGPCYLRLWILLGVIFEHMTHTPSFFLLT